MFQPHCNRVAGIRERSVCLYLGQSSPTQDTCVVVAVALRTKSPKGKIKQKGQYRALRFLNYLFIVHLGSVFYFFKDSIRFSYILILYTPYHLIVLLCLYLPPAYEFLKCSSYLLLFS